MCGRGLSQLFYSFHTNGNAKKMAKFLLTNFVRREKKMAKILQAVKKMTKFTKFFGVFGVLGLYRLFSGNRMGCV